MADAAVNLDVFLHVAGGTPEQMAAVIEKISLLATGIAMDGMRASVNISNEDDDYDTCEGDDDA